MPRYHNPNRTEIFPIPPLFHGIALATARWSFHLASWRQPALHLSGWIRVEHCADACRISLVIKPVCTDFGASYYLTWKHAISMTALDRLGLDYPSSWRIRHQLQKTRCPVWIGLWWRQNFHHLESPPRAAVAEAREQATRKRHGEIFEFGEGPSPQNEDGTEIHPRLRVD